jgi:SAM-dependent methyltransferase
MSMMEAGIALDEARFTEVAACDLCGSADAVELAPEAPGHCRTVLCRGCGLMYASPRLSLSELQRHYDEEFLGDAGSAARSQQDGVSAASAAKEDKLADGWSLPLVARHVDLAGASVLNLRARTGALSQRLEAAGAQVWSVDPFAGNLDVARRDRGLDRLVELSIPDIEALTGVGDATFDVVISLNVHLLAHLQSPRRFLDRAFQVLKPGGMLVMDEKDVLEPHWQRGGSVFESGQAHYYHFTLSTFARYVADAGFEIVSCRLDKRRVTAFQHVLIVARRPTAAGTRPALPEGLRQSPAEIETRVRRLHRTWILYRAGLAARLGRRAVKRSVRQVVHGFRAAAVGTARRSGRGPA